MENSSLLNEILDDLYLLVGKYADIRARAKLGPALACEHEFTNWFRVKLGEKRFRTRCNHVEERGY